VNIAASEGASVGAAAKGRVAFVGTNIKSFGKLVLVKHDGGIITAYAHLGDISVTEGDIVTAGQSIGTIGGQDASIAHNCILKSENRGNLLIHGV